MNRARFYGYMMNQAIIGLYKQNPHMLSLKPCFIVRFFKDNLMFILNNLYKKLTDEPEDQLIRFIFLTIITSVSAVTLL